MALDENEVVVAGTGHLWVAPVGTTLPAPNTDPTADLTGFVDLGYTEEDGVTLRGFVEISEFKVWQNTSPVRRSRTSQGREIQTNLVQWNEASLVAAFGGGTVDTSGSYPTYTFPEAGDVLQEYAVVLDWQDGDRNFRLVDPRMNAGLENVETTLNANSMAPLPILFRSLATSTSAYLVSDDAAAFVASS